MYLNIFIFPVFSQTLEFIKPHELPKNWINFLKVREIRCHLKIVNALNAWL